MAEDHEARVISVNVGQPRQFEYKGQSGESAIWKRPVEGRVLARGVNLEGDRQADLSVHGGPDKAVYAYALEDYVWWGEQLGRELEHGQFGENLTTEGIDLANALVGERWEVGDTLLEVSEARMPCWKLGARMDDSQFPKLFLAARRPGAYLRILHEGELGAEDRIRVVHRPRHDLTMGDLARIYGRDRHEAARLIGVPELSAPWRAWAEKWAARHADD